MPKSKLNYEDFGPVSTFSTSILSSLLIGLLIQNYIGYTPWPGLARHGRARPPMAGLGSAWPPMAGHGPAWLGMARHGRQDYGS